MRVTSSHFRAQEFHVQIFGGLQFQNGQAAGAGDAKKIQDSVLRGGLRKHSFVHLLGQERDIGAGGILLNDGLQPAFRWRAI
jgi:hypothetical protein